MSTRNWITENLILPASDIMQGHNIYKHFNFLMKSQYFTRSQIENYQNEKLRELIKHAYTNVPFYRDLFKDLNLKPEDIQNKNDLKKLPIITKDDLKKNKDKHFASNLKKNDLIFTSSSGSTGEPFQYYKTKNSASLQIASALRGWYWMGYRLGDKYVKISMNHRSSKIKQLQDKMNNCLYISSQELSQDAFKKIINKILKFNPDFIRSYPIPIKFLSESVDTLNINFSNYKLQGINTTGSTLHDSVRYLTENNFHTKIFDSYSCEGGSIFFECPTHECYHPAEEQAISEFIEDDYTLNDHEKPLRHITTDLFNYASPFIRYDTQDYIVLGDKNKCSCGRNFLNVKKIKGRDSDIIKTPSGKYLIVENFVAYFEWIKEVDQIQVIQDELNKIVINLVINESFNDETQNKIQSYWENYVDGDVQILINIVNEIKLTPSGKLRTVIRNPNLVI